MNASTGWHSQAPEEPTRAPFATQYATHFDLEDEPSSEVADIRFDDLAICVHRLSPQNSSANRLTVGTPCCAELGGNTTETVLDRVATRVKSAAQLRLGSVQ